MLRVEGSFSMTTERDSLYIQEQSSHVDRDSPNHGDGMR